MYGIGTTVVRRREVVRLMSLQILLVDHHRILRDGIKAFVEEGTEFEVMGEAESGAEAIHICKNERPDLVVMALGLPDLSGIEATTAILRNAPETRVIILSMFDDEQSVVDAIRSGARAYVLKTSSSRDLLEAFRTVAKGGAYLSPQVSDYLLQRIQSGNRRSKAVGSVLVSLSAREQEVLRLVASGKSSKDIARTLALALETVRSYRKTMMKKLGVTDIAGVTRVAFVNRSRKP
jgi:DNA-binding NarL/FixJ family response regulator